MNLILHLSSETESRLLELAASAGKNPEVVALEALEDKLAENGQPLSQGSSLAEFQAWFASHPTSRAIVLDDSRASIYEGRGE